ncbi:MAG: hypothetical protein U5K43_06665 [Halofilum sp. (in: g-proteobacteria)]|nr:hypothetical protein [Halofilum sp. (in: g-proteobacteria)]
MIGGYVATIFLAAAYVAMGLFVSARTDNQIVSLIVTVLIGGAFYVIGTDWFTALAPQPLAEFLRLIGTGSRFDEITRGVLDLRDVYYYVSLVAVFLALNVYVLEQLRWGDARAGARRHVAWRMAVGLVAVNFLTANLWLQPIATARADITADNRVLAVECDPRLPGRACSEPLAIRGYFSAARPIRCSNRSYRRCATCFVNTTSSAAIACASSSRIRSRIPTWPNRLGNSTTSSRFRCRRRAATNRPWSVPTSTC